MCGIRKREHTESDIITKILIFISKNYQNECTLLTASQHVGYDYNYVSKIFKRAVKISFNAYVNNMRISEACRLLTSTDASVQSIAESCGYTCTRTFNREFSFLSLFVVFQHHSIDFELIYTVLSKFLIDRNLGIFSYSLFVFATLDSFISPLPSSVGCRGKPLLLQTCFTPNPCKNSSSGFVSPISNSRSGFGVPSLSYVM